MLLLALFIAVPLIEIALFVQLGSVLALGWILLIVVLTAILGTWLVRRQGRGVLQQIQRSFNEVRDPTEPLAHGAMVLFAGALLLTPGFFTDTVGFLLLIPAVRMAAFRWLRTRVAVRATMTGGGFARHPGQPGGPGTGGPGAGGPGTGGPGTGGPGTGARRPQGEVIEGDYREMEPETPRRDPPGTGAPSGWTRGE